MRILIATDSFKDSLSAHEIAEVLDKGIKSSFPSAQIHKLALADGGEGTLEAIGMHANRVFCNTVDPLMRPIEAYYLLYNEEAYIEMALASGLQLLNDTERNPMLSSTFGTGILIKDAIGKGAKRIVLFVGGSATNDAGIGMAAALGFSFYDKTGAAVDAIGANIDRVAQIESPDFDFSNIIFEVATDVENVFSGPNGAAHVYARQKGANDSDVEVLDQGLAHLAEVFQYTYHIDVNDYAGAGAAGGIAGGAICFLGACIIKGADKIFEMIHLKSFIEDSDVVITGEGRIDSQTQSGKLIDRLILLAGHKKVIVLVGSLQASTYLLSKPNVIYASSIINTPLSLTEAKQQTKSLLLEKGMFLGKFLQHINI